MVASARPLTNLQRRSLAPSARPSPRSPGGGVPKLPTVDRRSPIDSAVATTRGDDGTTGLLFGGERIAKNDSRAEAYGTIDEAVAALGVARANLGVKRRIGTLPAGLGGLAPLILRLQRELFVAGAELATNPDAWDRLEDGRTRVSAGMVADVERDLVELERHLEMPPEFVVPGGAPTSLAAVIDTTPMAVPISNTRSLGLSSVPTSRRSLCSYPPFRIPRTIGSL